ncbi:Uncharacterised protein [Moraxella lacunata]|uniref:Uncharacterized protein n=1 Tax=Moraxella lacunata TaxID=477 RepID=A0A378TT05_MORLA|nr:hypothetical protein [Moraxella lacunata]STZ63444.1 Uncharacterised protein [Moraxella lacunata]
MRWLLCLMMFMSACAYANSHPNADELIGCLKHDEDKPYQSMMCLLPNQRVMISAMGMVVFGGYQLVDDVMSIEMDKPSVFAVMSRHNRYQDGTRLHIKGRSDEDGFLLQINDDEPNYVSGGSAYLCHGNDVNTLKFYANMNEVGKDGRKHQEGYAWQNDIPSGHNDIIVVYGTKRERFSQSFSYKLMTDNGRIYFTQDRADETVGRAYLSRDESELDFIDEYFDDNGNPIVEKLNNPNFILLNGFNQIDILMSDDQSYGWDLDAFDYHENGDYYTVKPEHLSEFHAKDDKIYRYHWVSNQPNKTAKTDMAKHQDIRQGRWQCQAIANDW